MTDRRLEFLLREHYESTVPGWTLRPREALIGVALGAALFLFACLPPLSVETKPLVLAVGKPLSGPELRR